VAFGHSGLVAFKSWLKDLVRNADAGPTHAWPQCRSLAAQALPVAGIRCTRWLDECRSEVGGVEKVLDGFQQGGERSAVGNAMGKGAE
jgi:hypothetical protein